MTDTDRIDAVAQALYGGRRWAEQLPWQVTYWRTMAGVAVAALDAYDRAHPTPATAYWKQVADRREESLDTLGRERNTWARQMADLRDERDAAKRDAEDARRDKNEAQNERDDLDHRLADLRERIAADIEAQAASSHGVFADPDQGMASQATYLACARIARGGQS